MSSHLYSLFGVEPLALKGQFVRQPVIASSNDEIQANIQDKAEDKLHAYGWFRDLLSVLPDSHAFRFIIAHDVEVQEGQIMLPDTILTAKQKRKLWDQLKDYV